MGYSAKAVANYFLTKYGNHGITPLKIQKLVYIAHGWNYVFGKSDLINDELAEAWPYGPVFPSIYNEFKYLGGMPIVNLAREFDFEQLEKGNMVSYEPQIPESDKRTRNLLDVIWKIYGKFTGSQLSEICHQNGSPWYKTRKEQPAIRNAHIPNEVIKKHYNELYKENRNSD